MRPIFYDGAEDLLRVAICVPLAYLLVVAFIRISGKRTTSQMNNFDWIVTVAMGSLVSSGILLVDVTLSEMGLAVGLLLTMQYAVTRWSPRSATLRRLVKPPPRLLFHDGVFLRDDMQDERVSELELRAAIRRQGFHDLDDVGAVVLETDATLSVLPATNGKSKESETLSDVVRTSR